MTKPWIGALLGGLLLGCQPSDGEVPFGPQAWESSRDPLTLADGQIELYMTRPGTAPGTGEDPELDDALAGLFDEASSEIAVSIYELNRPRIFEALGAAVERGVDVRFVGDGDEDEDEGYELMAELGVDMSLRKKRDRIMHNKFVVVDQRWVWTGSTNFSENGVLRNNNHGLLIDSPELADLYLEEFDQMSLDGSFGRKKAAFDHGAPVTLAGETLTTWFSPADGAEQALLAALDSADSTVLFMIFAYTRVDMAERMIALHEAGVQVVGIFDESQARGRYSVDDRLAEAGVPVYIDGNGNSSGFAGGKLHHKVLIVDPVGGGDPTTVIGSTNWSAGAVRYNDENLVVVEGPETAAAFTEEFCARLDEAELHPAYHGAAPDPCSALLQQVRVNEVLPNPAGVDGPGEFIEVVTAGAAPVDLTGWTLGDAANPERHVFEGVVLGPQEAFVVWSGGVRDGAWEAVASSGRLSLANNADEAVLRDASGRTVDRVSWVAAPAGGSFNRDPDGAVAGDFRLHDELEAGLAQSPGRRADGQPWGATAFINEVLPNPVGSDAAGEWVEIVNRGPLAVDLEGWTLVDGAGTVRHEFGAGYGLLGGEALVVCNGGTLPGSLATSSGGLSLNNSSEILTLFDGDGLERSVASWASSEEGVSLNREQDGDPTADLVEHSAADGASGDSSPGQRVDGVAWGAAVIINELLPDPVGADSGHEWVELVNVGTAPASLLDWTLGDAVRADRHVFSSLTLQPGEALVLGDDQASSGALSLNNSGDSVTLADSQGNTVSAVSYSGSSAGVSLNRAADGDPSAPLVDHDSVPGATGDSSPGQRVDGAAW